jgi:hypothetical protein
MPRHFPPAAWTSAFLALTFATLATWQGIRLVTAHREALRAWETARSDAEHVAREVIADPPPVPLSPESERSPTAIARSIPELRELLIRAAEHHDERILASQTRYANMELNGERKIESAESNTQQLSDEVLLKEQVAQDKVAEHHNRTQADDSPWFVTYDATRSPPWDPGPEAVYSLSWNDLAIATAGPLVTSPVVLANATLTYTRRRLAWEAGKRFCDEANRLDDVARQARDSLRSATQRADEIKLTVSRSLQELQDHTNQLIVNRERCSDAVTRLSASTTNASIRSGMLLLDVPALLASVAACFLALVRLALVTNWFSGRRILARASPQGGTMQGTSR